MSYYSDFNQIAALANSFPNPEDFTTIFFAVKLAKKAHANQFRRDGVTPYVYHVYSVALRAPKTPIDIAVALLHDSMEDDAANKLSYEEIDKLLGTAVADGVRVLTKGDKESYLDFINRIKITDNGRWVRLKIADILANLSDDPSPKQIKKYAAALLFLTED